MPLRYLDIWDFLVFNCPEFLSYSLPLSLSLSLVLRKVEGKYCEADVFMICCNMPLKLSAIFVLFLVAQSFDSLCVSVLSSSSSFSFCNVQHSSSRLTWFCVVKETMLWWCNFSRSGSAFMKQDCKESLSIRVRKSMAFMFLDIMKMRKGLVLMFLDMWWILSNWLLCF